MFLSRQLVKQEVIFHAEWFIYHDLDSSYSFPFLIHLKQLIPRLLNIPPQLWNFLKLIFFLENKKRCSLRNSLGLRAIIKFKLNVKRWRVSLDYQSWGRIVSSSFWNNGNFLLVKWNFSSLFFILFFQENSVRNISFFFSRAM